LLGAVRSIIIFQGAWDGKEHTDEYQREMNGSIVGHKHYYVPTLNYLMFMKQYLKRAIDAGLESIYIEEPEFWAESGYSESFKREWRGYYGFEWRPQHESAENTYLSNKLKYYLYYRALNECFTFCKEYGKDVGQEYSLLCADTFIVKLFAVEYCQSGSESGFFTKC
jgi:hypothetical protein